MSKDKVKMLEDKRDRVFKQLQDLYRRERTLKQKINQIDVLINQENKRS